MEYKMAGRIVLIKPTETIQTRNGGTYTKREIVLDCTRFDSITGERGFDNFPYFTFSGEKVNLLDNFQLGQVVSISFYIQGYNGSRGDDAYFNTVRGYRIEPVQTQYQPQQQQTYTQAPTQPVVYQQQVQSADNDYPF